MSISTPRRMSQVSQPGLEVVKPTPPPKILIRGSAPRLPAGAAGLSRGAGVPASTHAQRHQTHTRGRLQQQQPQHQHRPQLRLQQLQEQQQLLQLHQQRERQQLQAVRSAWSESPTSDRGGDLLFPSARGSPWPLLGSSRGGPTPHSQKGGSGGSGNGSGGRRSAADRRTFEVLARKRFWLACGPIFVLLLLGLAVGLGVGLAAGKARERDANRDRNGNGSENGSRTPVPTPAATTDRLAPTPIMCPDADGTVYQSPQRGAGSDVFLVRCDVAYFGGGDGGVTANAEEDLGQQRDTETVEACIEACADDEDCVGADWGKRDGKYTCWMKGGSVPGIAAEQPGWYSVIKKTKKQRDRERERDRRKIID